MSAKVERAIQQADDTIMALCGPEEMTPQEAIDFLYGVIEHCRAVQEALREENEDL